MRDKRTHLEQSGGSNTLLQFALFLALGGLAALTNLVARYLLNFIMPFEIAVILAYMAGMIVAFVLFGKLIFDGSEATLWRRINRFVQVNVLGAILAWVVSIAMARFVLPAAGWTWHPLEISHFIGVAAPAFSSYFLHKHYTFV